MLNLNQEKFSQVVKTALANSADSKRWRNAIVRAEGEIKVNPSSGVERWGADYP